MKTPLRDRGTASIVVGVFLLVTIVFLLNSLFQTFHGAVAYRSRLDALVEEWHELETQSRSVFSSAFTVEQHRTFLQVATHFGTRLGELLKGDVIQTLVTIHPELNEMTEAIATTWVVLEEEYNRSRYPAILAHEARIEGLLERMDSWFEAYGELQLRALEQMFILLGMATILAGVLLVVLTAAMTRQQAARARAQEQLRTVLEIQEEERRRIAQDLHDDLAQEITSAKMATANLEEHIGSSHLDLAEEIRDIGAILERTLSTTRTIAHGLRPVQLEHFGVGPAVENLCREMEHSAGIPVDFSAVGLRTARLRQAAEIGAFRIVQEAITNSLKHSGASRLTVRLVTSHPWLILRVEDDGAGYAADSRGDPVGGSPGMGIQNIRERVLLLRGRLRILTKPGRGTVVEVRLPAGHTDSDLTQGGIDE